MTDGLYGVYFKDDGLLYYRNPEGLEYAISGTIVNPSSSKSMSFDGFFYPPDGVVPINGLELAVEEGKSYKYTASIKVVTNSSLGQNGVAGLSLGGSASISSADLTLSAPGHADVQVTDLSDLADQISLTVAPGSLFLTIEGTVTVDGDGSLKPYFKVISPNITSAMGTGPSTASWLELL